ncbi:hypothetical protein JCM10212_004712 [Sporobolomyces blumeae]
MPMLFPPSASSQTPQSILSSVPASTSPSSPHFLVFLSSVDPSTGKMWCGDCRDVEQVVDKVVPQGDQSQLVFVGERAEWKDSNSPWRQPPFNLSAIPTIVKVTASPAASSLDSHIESAPRLVENEMKDEAKLKAFVESS